MRGTLALFGNEIELGKRLVNRDEANIVDAHNKKEQDPPTILSRFHDPSICTNMLTNVMDTQWLNGPCNVLGNTLLALEQYLWLEEFSRSLSCGLIS